MARVTSLGAVRALAARFVASGPGVGSAEDLASFDAYARERSIGVVRVLVPALIAIVLAFWPFDLRLYGRHFARVGLTEWRIGQIVVLGVLYLGVRTLRAVRARCPEAIAFTALVSVALSAWMAARLGPGTRFISELYLAPFTTLLVLVPLAKRAVLVAALTADCFGVAFIENPAVTSFATWWAVMIASAVVAFVIGHAFFFLLRENFIQRLSLARAAKELEDLNGALEARVAARTKELRALAGHLSEVLEQERARIARDVHDDLGQRLAAMRLEVDLASRLAEEREGLAEPLDRLEKLVASTLESARRIMTELRPQGLDEFGLVAAVERLVEDFRRRQPCACDLSIDPDFATDPRRATALFRIIQESLTNVVKHAGAKRVEIALAEDEGVIRLVVRDDGRGLPSAVRPGAMGLLGMRERAWQFGGQVTVVGDGGRGTTVDVEIPAVSERQPAHAHRTESTEKEPAS